MVALLAACAGCSGADVVSILAKMRVPLAEVSVEVRGTRREEEPRRYVSLHFRYQLKGAGLPVAKVERAVKLSLEKYCSVVHSLAPDIPVTWEVHVA